MNSSNAFWNFEHTGWEKKKAVNYYHDYFGTLTSQVIPSLLDAVKTKKGQKVLDVATGPGYAAFAASQRGADVTGIDFSSSMIKKAQKNFPEIQFKEGDAEDLPFNSNSFDAVTINFGVLHLAHPEKALAEAYRVLKPKGRIGFTVWAKPEEAIGFHIVLSAIKTYGTLDVAIPQAPPFFRFSDADESKKTLKNIGYISPKVQTVSQLWRFHKPEELFVAFYEGAVRTGGILRAQSKNALQKIRQTINIEAEKYRKHDLIEIPMPAVLSSAVKP